MRREHLTNSVSVATVVVPSMAPARCTAINGFVVTFFVR